MKKLLCLLLLIPGLSLACPEIRILQTMHDIYEIQTNKNNKEWYTIDWAHSTNEAKKLAEDWCRIFNFKPKEITY